MLKEYKTIREVVGPLMLVEGVEGVTYNELVEIRQESGEIRRGKVLEIEGDKALVQLFEPSHGLRIDNSAARFLGRGIELSVSMEMLGRIIKKRALHEYGATQEMLEEWTGSVLRTQERLMQNNYVPLDAERVLKIYRELF